MIKPSKTYFGIRFNDIDIGGHVHNAKYFDYFEIGRIDFFKQVAPPTWNWMERGVLVARNEADYIQPVRFHDKVFIETSCEHVGTKSITLTYHLFKETEKGTELCAKGKSVLVCVDKTGSVNVFEEWKTILLA